MCYAHLENRLATPTTEPAVEMIRQRRVLHHIREGALACLHGAGAGVKLLSTVSCNSKAILGSAERWIIIYLAYLWLSLTLQPLFNVVRAICRGILQIDLAE